MTKAQIASMKRKVKAGLKHVSLTPAQVDSLLPVKINSLQGKLYEAYVLADVCKNLVRTEGLSIKLVKTKNIILKQKGGPINRHFPHFEVYKAGNLIGELWTDVYFTTLSFELKNAGVSGVAMRADYHELDIALLEDGLIGLPNISQIMLAVECKNTVITKSIIREIIGFRREMGFFMKSFRGRFAKWPSMYSHCETGSISMLYSPSKYLSYYSNNLKEFGVVTNQLK